MSARSTVRRSLASATLALLAGCVLTACSTSETPATPSASSTTAAARATSTGGAAALEQVCAGYDTTRGIARQLVSSAASPIVASGPVFFLITLRQTASSAIVTVPEFASVFVELRDAIDDLNQQATAALPPGADGSKTRVALNASRLGAALDRVDKLCPAVTPTTGN